jgi:hypothetical protein
LKGLERKKEKKMLQEEGDDDDSAARMMLWETNNRRAAALPPLGRVLATIFAAEYREVEKNLVSDSARTKQGKNPKPFLFFLNSHELHITLWQPIFFSLP